MKKNIRYILGVLVVLAALLTGRAGFTESGSDSYSSTVQSGNVEMQEDSGMNDAGKSSASDDGSASQKKSGTYDVGEGLSEVYVEEDGEYTSKEEVAAYLHTYGHLPDNFITKSEAKKLGWVSSEGNLGDAAPGKSIGGDYFGNYEGSLPEQNGREYHECDIDSDGGYRGAKRIIYSNDGLIYYTEDHYKTFELLYGEE